jgi:hypothetical protein
VGEETIAKLLPKGLAKKKELERGNLCHTLKEFGNHHSHVKMHYCFLIIAYGG